jgi:hypothetical protein
MGNGNSPSEGAKVLGLLAYFRPGFHIDTPEGAINRLPTILRKTALIVLDDWTTVDVRIGSDACSTEGETGLATPRR